MNQIPLAFIAIGPQKTGTTWLYSILSQSKTICFPRNVKETMFFDLHYDSNLARYRSYYRHRAAVQFCAEIAPSYFDIPEVPNRIRNHFPDCKIIISLRSPIERTFSLFCHHLKKGRISSRFEDAIKEMPRILTSGRYEQHIPRWINTFGLENILFLFMEDIRTKPATVINQTCHFINLTEHLSLSDAALQNRVNQASIPKYPLLAKVASSTAIRMRSLQLDRIVELAKSCGITQVYSGGEKNMPKLSFEERVFLTEYYAQDVSYVENLLNVNLNAWRN